MGNPGQISGAGVWDTAWRPIGQNVKPECFKNQIERRVNQPLSDYAAKYIEFDSFLN